jgi:hypothetical protein
MFTSSLLGAVALLLSEEAVDEVADHLRFSSLLSISTEPKRESHACFTCNVVEMSSTRMLHLRDRDPVKESIPLLKVCMRALVDLALDTVSFPLSQPSLLLSPRSSP